MAQPPHRSQQQHTQSRREPERQERQEPPRHPAQPPAARPGVAQRDQQPRPDDPADQPPPEEKVVDPAEAGQLFRAGHRLKRKGDPPDKWFAAFRLHNTLVICYPMDDEIEKQLLEQDLVLADDPPGQSGGTPIFNPPL
jgi:hypothetical protein